METNMKPKIFISHSSTDAALINALLRFLRDGLEVNIAEIFCTSLSGTLATGYGFVPQIQESLVSCKKVLFIITENYLKSPFCMAELGAAWAINQNVYPIIVPPVGVTEYNRTPLIGIQSNDISHENSLAVLNDELVNDGIVTRVGTPQFLSAEREFKTSLNKFLRVLKTDSEGWITATVDKFEQLSNNGILYHSYKIKEQVDTGSGFDKNETHWILLRGKSSFHLTQNEKIKFRMADIRNNEKEYDNRYFIVSNLWIANAEL